MEANAYKPGNYLNFDNNFLAIFKDALSGDPKALDMPEIRSLGMDNIKAALEWLQTVDLNGDYKNLLANEGWRLAYKRKPPTPEEFLTYDWIGGQCEGLWPNVKKAFIEFMDPNPLNPKRGLALSTSIGWGKDQPVDAKVVIDKTIDIELEDGNVLHIPSNDVLDLLEDRKEVKIKANKLLDMDLVNIDFPQKERNSAKIKRVGYTYKYKTIGEFKIGDEVVTEEGDRSHVLNILETGKRDVYKLTLSNGKSFETSESHVTTVLFRYSPERPDKKVYDTLTTKYIKDHLGQFLFEIPTDDTYRYKDMDYIQHIEALPVHEYEPVDDEFLIPIKEKDPGKVYIEKIEKLEDQKTCRCLQLSDPMGWYLTEDGIFTHNSLLTNLCMSYIITLFGLMREPHKILGHSAMTSYSQPYGTLVQLKDNSWKPIECLIVGDELKPILDEESRVTTIIEQGEQDTYELDFGNNKRIQCSLGHWWLLWDFETNKYVKIQTRDFIENKDRYGVPELEDLKKDRDLIIECHKQFEKDHTPLIQFGFEFVKS